MKVLKNIDGTWRVENNSGFAVMTGVTNAKAWLFVDNQNRENLNKAQDQSDWVATRLANGE